MSTTALPPPFSLAEKLGRDRNRDRQRRGSVASTSSRRVLPRKEYCLLGSDNTNKEPSDALRRRPVSICSSLGRGSEDSVTSTLRTEKRVSLGMGLREQEQHMIKIGRENWALKIDVTMLKKKRDELGTMNEKLTRQVETLSRENRQLKRDLTRTKEELEKRERELDEACRMYERLGATSVVLEELSRKQQVQHHQQPPHEGYILEGGKCSAPRSHVMRVEGSRSSPRLGYSKTPQSTSQAPEFLGPSVHAGGRVSPTLSDRSTTSTSTGISRSRLQSPLPNKHQAFGLPFLSSPSVSTCCSLRRIPIPRHVASEGEEADDDSSSGEDMPTPQRGPESEEGTDYISVSGSEYQETDDPKSNCPPQLVTPKFIVARAHASRVTPPSSIASAYTKRGSLRRKILKFNREEEPDTSDDSSEEEDMFDSDIGGSITSLQHTLTPMTASPEPNKAYLVTGEHDVERKPRASALATVAKRVSYTGPVSGDLEPIDEQSVLPYCNPTIGDLQLPERINFPTSSVVNVNTRGNKSRIPAPSTTSAVAQRRRHLDSLSRLVVGRVALARKMLQA
ncbi:hypothetical protein BGX38DRAFT_1143422 [Terfezia claveryi]|nr:hypothetical protein BGX38DRAFT_1143422 [Terfezia claveryi]